ncbi:hypothetical protein Golax_004011 [Gossypium laxum]|uniref:Pyrophosphate--fructose 6-phosphate 1-phosphotransferase subunit alpha n=1 Tax=Gossypium laxum TaxID=34288 RepID=A0A7J9AHL2_9ROSI|nr:hypothetical protein [Gossypium laxum]
MPQRRKNPKAFSYFIWLDYKSCYFIIIIIICIQVKLYMAFHTIDVLDAKESFSVVGGTFCDTGDWNSHLCFYSFLFHFFLFLVNNKHMKFGGNTSLSFDTIHKIIQYTDAYDNCLSWEQTEESDNINNVMDELYREAGTTLLEEPDSSMELMDTHREDEDHIRKIKEFQDYLQMVKIMIKPGCSEEVLKVALNSMSSLVGILAFMSYPKRRSSL